MRKCVDIPERSIPMKHRLTVIALIATLLLTLCGCSEVVNDIAGNVADAALKELEVQIRDTVNEYKVEIVELKSAVGRLNNDSDSDLQFFCGLLVRSNSDALPQSVCDALDNLFERSGMCRQKGSTIQSELLSNKTISFKHTDFSSDDYYLIWVYSPSLTQKLSELELPTLPAGWLPTGESKSVG